MKKDIETVDQAQLIEAVREAVGNGGTIRITVVGMSMFPFLRSMRDSVVLAPVDKIRKNDVLFYVRADGSCVLHRCIKIENDEYIMCGDNQTELEHGIHRKDVIARAESFVRKGRTVMPSALHYRAYTAVWCGLFGLRPVMSRCVMVYFRVKAKLGR